MAIAERSSPHTNRIPIDPAILATIEHCFIVKKKKKTKNADAQVLGDMYTDQKPDNFFVGLKP